MGSPFETGEKAETDIAADQAKLVADLATGSLNMLTRRQDDSLRIVAVDPALADWLGADALELTGLDWRELLDEPESPMTKNALAETVSGDTPARGRLVFRGRGGEAKPCSFQCRPLFGGADQFFLWQIEPQTEAVVPTAGSDADHAHAVFSLLDYMVGYLVNRTRADTGVLLLQQGSDWRAHTVYPDTEDLAPVPAAASELLACVKNSKVLVIERDASQRFATDPLVSHMRSPALIGLTLESEPAASAILLLFFREPLTSGKSLTKVIGRHRAALIAEVSRLSHRQGLPEREARFRDLFENAHDLVQSISPGGRFLYVNRIWREKLEYNAEELKLLHVLDVVHSAYKESFQDCMERMLQDQTTTEHLEFMMVSKSGQVIVAEGDLSVRQLSGRTTAIRGIFRDITRRRKSEEELRLARELANATIHNIGNVLNSVNASCHAISETVRTSSVHLLEKVNRLFERHQDDLGQFLSEDGRGKLLPQFIQQVTGALHEENTKVRGEMNDLRRLLSLIKDIAFSQQALARENPAMYEDIGLQDLLEEALTIQIPGKLHASIQVVRDYRSAGMVVGPRGAIVHVVMNILKNARQALESNSRDNRKLELSIFNDEEWTVVRVRDNGPGISPDHLARIFDYGFTTKPEGHGFGLHYCAKVMRDLGGSLAANSDGPGKGSTFDLRFLTAN